MNYKLRFYDVVNYFLLGAAFIVMIVFITTYKGILLDIDLISSNNFDSMSLLSKSIFLVLFVAVSYFAGLVLSAIVDIRSSIKLEQAKWYNIIRGGTIQYACETIKQSPEKIKLLGRFSRWIFFTTDQYRTLSIIAEKISRDKDFDDLHKYKYLNKFFLGSSAVSCIVLAYTMCLFIAFVLIKFYQFSNNTDGKSDSINFLGLDINYAIITLFFIASNSIVLWLSKKAAKLYAEKFIIYVSECVEARDIDIRNNVINETIPAAYILFKAKDDIKFDFFTDAMKSILAQDYPNIKVILYIYGKNANSYDSENCHDEKYKTYQYIDSTMYEISSVAESNKLHNIEIIKFIGKHNNVAQASYDIRKRFIDMASKDDVAIFLDAKDELANKDSVSNIMLKFALTNANICLLNFTEVNEIGYSLIRNDKDVYNDLLEFLSTKSYTDLPDDNEGKYKYLCSAATMGCAKAYKKDIIKKFMEIIDNFEKVSKYRFTKLDVFTGFFRLLHTYT